MCVCACGLSQHNKPSGWDGRNKISVISVFWLHFDAMSGKKVEIFLCWIQNHVWIHAEKS